MIELDDAPRRDAASSASISDESMTFRDFQAFMESQYFRRGGLERPRARRRRNAAREPHAPPGGPLRAGGEKDGIGEVS